MHTIGVVLVLIVVVRIDILYSSIYFQFCYYLMH